MEESERNPRVLGWVIGQVLVSLIKKGNMAGVGIWERD